MSLLNKRLLLVVAPNGFRDEEYFEVKKDLESAGLAAQTASLTAGSATSVLGRKIAVDLAVNQVALNLFDGVVFIGGKGMVDLVDNKDFINLVHRFKSAGKLTAAICVAPLILANAGLLTGKRATVCFGDGEELAAKGAIYTAKQAEADGYIITADGPRSTHEFSRKIIDFLAKK